MDRQVNLRASDGQIGAWREAAGREPLSRWIRRVLDKAAGTPAGTPKTSPEKSDRKAVRVRQLQAQGHTGPVARQIAEQEEA